MTTRYSETYVNDPVQQQPLHEASPLQHVETVKDIMTLELRRYFAGKVSEFKFLTEVPMIEKYKITDGTQDGDPFVSAVQIMRALPDINQKLPLLAITTATGRTKKFGIGGQYAGVVQEPPRVRTNRGPWNIPENSQVLFTTKVGLTLITFTTAYVADFTKMQPVELMAAINAQSSRLVASIMPDSSICIQLKTPKLSSIAVTPVTAFDYTPTLDAPSPDRFGLMIGDGFQASGISNSGKNADAATILGLVGQTDDVFNVARPPKHRYQTAKDLVLNVDIGAEDDNQRTELTDLVSYFFELFLQERDFVLLGDTSLGQNWQIAMKCELQLSGESEIPRLEGDQSSKIYINRVSVPLLSIDYVDRVAVMPSQVSRQPLVLGGDS